MFDRYVAQLQDSDPAKRREAIIALGKLANPQAMPALAQVYRTDPDPSLRDLARKAGLNIRNKNAQNPAAVPPQPPPQQPSSQPASADDMPSFDDIVSRSPSAPQPSNAVFTAPIDDPAGDDEESLLAVLGGGSRESSSAYDDVAEPPSLYEGESSTLIYDEPPEQELIGDAKPSSSPPSTAQAASSSVPVRGREYDVTREDRERASRIVESALTLHMRGDKGKSVKLLGDALAINPNLINDHYYASIAASVTGLDGDGAIQMIVDSGRRTEFVKTASQQAKAERKEKHISTTQEVTWSALGIDALIYFVILTVGTLLFFLILIQSLQGLFDTLTSDPTFAASLPPDFATLTEVNTGALLLASLSGGLTSLITILLHGVMTHLLATGVFGGKGTYAYMMAQVLRVNNRWLPFFFLLLYILVAVMFIAAGSPVILCILLPIFGLSIYIFFKIIGKVGEAYDFGLGFGFLSYVLALVLISVLASLAGVLIGRLAGGLLPT